MVRLDVGGGDVPGEQDPGVLADLGDIGIDQRAAGGLGVDRREMRPGQHLAHDSGGGAGVDQVVDDQPAVAVAGGPLEDDGPALVAVVVCGDADGVDEAYAELAGDDRGRHQTAAGYRDDAFEGSQRAEPPGQRAGVAGNGSGSGRERGGQDV